MTATHQGAPEIIGRETLHKGAKFDFERLTVRSPAGKTLQREIVRHPGAVVILPVLPDGHIVLIRNFRIAMRQWMWELPAGTLDPRETPAACAARELTEETGYIAGKIEPIADFRTTPGMTDERMHAFLATGLTPSRQALEEDEMIEVQVVPAARALAMIDSGDLTDGKSMVALLLAEKRGLLSAGHAGVAAR